MLDRQKDIKEPEQSQIDSGRCRLFYFRKLERLQIDFWEWLIDYDCMVRYPEIIL